MSAPRWWKELLDLVGTIAVVVSLIYVGLQIRQNTSAIQTSTSEAVYQLYQEQSLAVMQSPEMTGILLHAARVPETMTASDSVRYDSYLGLTLNLQESVYTSALHGTMEPGMAAGWLAGLPGVRCTPGMDGYWKRYRTQYQPAFRAAMDSVFATTACPARG